MSVRDKINDKPGFMPMTTVTYYLFVGKFRHNQENGTFSI